MSIFKVLRKQIPYFFIPLFFLVVFVDFSIAQKEQIDRDTYPVAPMLFYEELYPCQACHRKDIRETSGQTAEGKSFFGKYFRAPNPKPRVLKQMHMDIKLNHGSYQWCLNCHSTYERNYLKLINGELITFEESYLLCGQCHGTIYRDWKMGIHGRRMGQWNGKKLYLLCVHCHDPHNPKFRQIVPKDPPRPPEYGRWDSKD